jgi:hypothetical protein
MTKFVELTYQEWVDRFKPIPNHISKYNTDGSDISFETYGEEVDFVISKANENKVWTWADGDMCSYISNGYHYVNRINYHVCEVPYEDDTEYQIITSVEEECECYNEEGYDDGEYGRADCSECEGYGLVTKYND